MFVVHVNSRHPNEYYGFWREDKIEISGLGNLVTVRTEDQVKDIDAIPLNA